jgi:protein-L-isoaspartate O-methyltransferase
MIVERLLKGDPRRRTRLHDFEGNLLPISGLLDLIPCTVSTLLSKTGWRSSAPWLPYPAVRYLERLIGPSWRVLEFGSGASTVWLSARAARVVSYEHDAQWHARTAAALAALGRENVDLRLRSTRNDYIAVEEKPFDLVLVDGHWRNACAEVAVRLVRPGGFIYLDNSDVPDQDHRIAVDVIGRVARESRRFVGLCPGHLAVNQGLLVRTQ